MIWGSELGLYFSFGLMCSFGYCSFYLGKEMGQIKGYVQYSKCVNKLVKTLHFWFYSLLGDPYTADKLKRTLAPCEPLLHKQDTKTKKFALSC